MGRKDSPLPVRIDPDLKKELYTLVKAKYSGLRGGLKLEVEAAIRQHLSLQHTAQHTRIDPKLPRVLRECNRIISRITTAYPDYEKISQTDLDRVIEVLEGNDPRTKKKWTKALLDYRYVELSGPYAKTPIYIILKHPQNMTLPTQVRTANGGG